MNELVDSTAKKLAKKDENLKDMMLAMKKEMKELKGELMIYKVALSNGMLSSRPKQQAMDVPKSKKFKGARSTNEKRGGNVIGTLEEFQKELKKQFYPQYVEKEARAKLRRFMQQGTVREYVWAFSELMLQISDLSEKEEFY
ncbi:hypothetical protein Gotur_018793 [Gossypium turneri]